MKSYYLGTLTNNQLSHLNGFRPTIYMTNAINMIPMFIYFEMVVGRPTIAATLNIDDLLIYRKLKSFFRLFQAKLSTNLEFEMNYNFELNVGTIDTMNFKITFGFSRTKCIRKIHKFK